MPNSVCMSVPAGKQAKTQVFKSFLAMSSTLFINDVEMTKLLFDYDKLDIEEKTTIKKIIRAFKFYSKIESTQQEMSI